MSGWIVRMVLVGMITSVLTGCGTIHNMGDECSPYGGVATDLRVCRNIQDGKGMGHMCDWSYPPIAALVFGYYCFQIIDVPFSAFGDTLTLPWTLTAQAKTTERPVVGDDTPRQ
jgi:uncharacterized protein YceK